MKQKLFFLTLIVLSSQAYADYRDDIGYTQLQTELGVAPPDGNGVAVTQVEAAIGVTETNAGAWMPEIGASQFSGKSILDQSLPVSNGISGHATGVGGLFYGNTSSMASGIVEVDVYFPFLRLKPSPFRRTDLSQMILYMDEISLWKSHSLQC